MKEQRVVFVANRAETLCIRNRCCVETRTHVADQFARTTTHAGCMFGSRRSALWTRNGPSIVLSWHTCEHGNVRRRRHAHNISQGCIRLTQTNTVFSVKSSPQRPGKAANGSVPSPVDKLLHMPRHPGVKDPFAASPSRCGDTCPWRAAHVQMGSQPTTTHHT